MSVSFEPPWQPLPNDRPASETSEYRVIDSELQHLERVIRETMSRVPSRKLNQALHVIGRIRQRPAPASCAETERRAERPER